jgi:AAA domain
MTLELAARVSAGKAFPDGAGCEPAGVVLLSAEDGLADTIRPRLDAAGAVTSKILALATVPDEDGHDRLLSIPKDLALIEKGIRRVGARLVVVDPLMAFLSGETNSHRDQDVRRALAPLGGLAERTGAAVLVVRHLNKAQANNPLYRGGGSIGIIGAARMAFVVGKDPQDDNRRVLASTKNNLAMPPRSLVFSLREAEGGSVRVNWLGQSEVSAKDLLATSQESEHADARAEAVEFLNDGLTNGPLPARQVIEEADDAGIAEKTLRRAKKDLGVIVYRENTAGEGRGSGRWMWKLPMVKLVESGVQGGQAAAKQPGGHLEQIRDPRTGASRTDKPNVQDGHAVSSRWPHVQDGQRPSLPEGGHLKECIHGYRAGKGCYVCDPEHPYRLRIEATT